MTNEEIEAKVIELAAQVYKKDPNAITRDSNIKEDLGPKSLQLISLLALIEDEFEVLVSNRDALKFKTLGELIDRVTRDYGE